MQMLRNLLEKLNRIWYQKSRVSSTLTLRKGAGSHSLVTVEGGVMYFHSLPFANQMTQAQTVLLDDMTMTELVTTIQGMGYEVTVDAGAVNLGIMDESSLLLLEVANRSLVSGETLYAFTSNLWRVTYPIHRKLVEAGRDVDMAVEQLLLPSARGEWLDYWVGFFKMKRLPDESDELLLRRAFMSIASVKSNDLAIEELISYYIEATVSVRDYAPNIFEVRVSPEYMDSAQKVRDLVQTLKGAGVDYILNYANQFAESYPESFRSYQGKTMNEVNASYRSVSIDFGRAEDNYSTIPPDRAMSGFILNQSRLNSSQRLSVSDRRIIEKLGMVMTQGGTVIKEM